MATGTSDVKKQESDVKKQESDDDSLDEFDEKVTLQQMIDYINSRTDYAVVTKAEMGTMQSSSQRRQPLHADPHSQRLSTSTPTGARRRLPSTPAPPLLPLPYGTRPNIPAFSGENKAGEVTFDVWKYDVKCLLSEGVYPASTIRQSIRNSLRGKARSILVTMGEYVTPDSIILKLESTFGNVCDKEAILEDFYRQSQNTTESVAEYGMRLANLLQIPVDRGHITSDERDSMLRSKFFSGLKDPLLKTAIRFKYEATRDFDTLLRDTRAIEQQMKATSAAPTPTQPDTKPAVKQQTTSRVSLEDIAKKLETLTTQVNDLQTEMSTVRNGNQRQGSSYRGTTYGNHRGSFSNRGTSQSRQFYRGARSNYPRNQTYGNQSRGYGSINQGRGYGSINQGRGYGSLNRD
ncbi:hypothetical protein FSP39_020876 [Pinctada imbricata]|uniref:Paraneoplastic antigen Ma-like C-terminal domain-containing protein n=1 Tax=Pinctada imbricata TaxID=66713 RepID=A0AA88YGU6_PINIB|nr:hypothetical protein FSP39_020876 [Pinctada imbricata]